MTQTLSVIEPATEAVLQELPRAGVEEVDAAVARAKAALPAWRALSPADRAALLRRIADAVESQLEELATLEARNAGKPITDARGEIGMVVDTFRYYAGAPERLLGRHDPGRGRGGDDVPRAAGRRRTDRAMELPADDRGVEARAGAGGGEHGRPQAGRAHAADRGRVREARPRCRPAGGRGERRRGPGQRVRNADGRTPGHREDRVHRVDRGRADDRRGRGADDQARDARARRQVGQRRVRRRRRRGGRRGGAGRGVRERRPGLLRAFPDPRRAVGRRSLPRRDGRCGPADPRRRSARRVDLDGAVDQRRSARAGVGLRARRRADRDPGQGARRPRLLVPADRPVPDRPRRARSGRRDLRPDRRRAAIRRRGRARSSSPTTRSTG